MTRLQRVAPATRVPEIAAGKIRVQLNLSGGCAASRTPCLQYPVRNSRFPPRMAPDFLPLYRQVARRQKKRSGAIAKEGSDTRMVTNDRDRASPTNLGKARPEVRQAHQVSGEVAVRGRPCPATVLSDPQTTELLTPLLVELRLLPLHCCGPGRPEGGR